MHSDSIFAQAASFVNSMHQYGRAHVPAMKASDFPYFMSEVHNLFYQRPLGDFSA